MINGIKIKDFPAYHGTFEGRLKGDRFTDQATFFAHKPEISVAYAEHKAYSDHYEDFDLDQYNYPITLYPVLLTFDNPAVTSREFLFDVGKDIGVKEEYLHKFADVFEDSDHMHRDLVFDYLKRKGYDAVIMPNDMMPECAGGDWDLQTSYVAFYPSKQIKFKLLKPEPIKTDFRPVIDYLDNLKYNCYIENPGSADIDSLEYQMFFEKVFKAYTEKNNLDAFVSEMDLSLNSADLK